MDHAKQVIGPLWQVARTPITEGDKLEAAEAVSQFGHLVVGDIPHHHGIGAITQLAVAHYHPEAFNNAALLQRRYALYHSFFTPTDLLGDVLAADGWIGKIQFDDVADDREMDITSIDPGPYGGGDVLDRKELFKRAKDGCKYSIKALKAPPYELSELILDGKKII